MRSLFGGSPEELTRLLGLGKEARGQRLFRQLQAKNIPFKAMTGLPAGFPEKLEREYSYFSSRLLETVEDEDGTIKLKVGLSDGAKIECVLLKDRAGRKTACLSSQAGCAMGCTFCRTGRLGFKRSLEAAEIIEQYHHLNRLYGPIGNIVFMGMGEPLENLEEFRKSVCLFIHPYGTALALRRMTVSTCGVVPGIRELADKGPAIGIAVSLVTALEEVRRELMPAARKWNLQELKEAVLYHSHKTRKRPTIEIVLLKGVNDDKSHVEALEEFLHGLDAVVNLIPWNPVPGLPFEAPGDDAVRLYYEPLTAEGVLVTRRFRRGTSISGACGQLGEVGVGQ